jgi:predicted O-methyltransferase YrrM
MEIWSAVDDWVETRFVPEDPALEGALAAADAARLLELLVRMVGARSVLEVGTLAGYSTLWLARGLPAGGRVLTLELDPTHADVARANLAAAGLGDVVEVALGPAAGTLAGLTETFDLVFIDADKPSTPAYFAEAVRLSHPGTVIVVDNVVRKGAVAGSASTDPNVRGIQEFAELVAADPRLRGTAIQTVGRKGYDGFALVVVGE